MNIITKISLTQTSRQGGLHLWKTCLVVFFGLLLFASCKEEDDEVEEYANWQAVNEQFMQNKFDYAAAGNDANWFYIKNYTFSDSVAATSQNSIVVHVLESGTGTDCPLYTDSVLVNYRGNLIKSTSYTYTYDSELGLTFDQSFVGEYSPETALPASFSVSNLVDGFTTALLHMHVGDRWRVYMPYGLAYGESGNSSGSVTIPGYSTLSFEIQLQGKCHAGQSLPIVK